jgi:GGDEF domain-containing protein
MCELVRCRIRNKYPAVFTLRVDPKSERDIQTALLLDEHTVSELDGLLTDFLRKPAFIDECYERMPNLLAEASVFTLKSALELLVPRKNVGAIAFGDVAYLKQANNAGREEGDRLLKTIAKVIRHAGFDVYGRFREGDEFICYSQSVIGTYKAYERVRALLRSETIIDTETGISLPVQIDFGVVSYSEVAQTYIKILERDKNSERDKKIIPKDRPRKNVFFDIALLIAEKRSEITKIYERAKLLTTLMKHVVEGRMDQGVYDSVVETITRGGKFVLPNAYWLTLDEEQLSRTIMGETLSFLTSYVCTDMEREVFAMAESLYVELPILY